LPKKYGAGIWTEVRVGISSVTAARYAAGLSCFGVGHCGT
jgi:hypothetical protein